MAEVDPIQIYPIAGKKVDQWFVTDRPIKIDKSKIKPSLLARFNNSSDREFYELGFNGAEIEDWVKGGYPVLEIGPGQGESSKYLLRLGVNLSVMEPSLRYVDDPKPEMERTRGVFSRPEFQGRVSAANAADVEYAFPDKRFRVAFAIGMNFESFSRSEDVFFNQIGGVLAALEDRPDSYFAFQLNEPGFVLFRQDGELTNRVFNLLEFMRDNNIRFDGPSEFLSSPLKGDGGRASWAIRVFEQDADGQDVTGIFDSATPKDLAKYVEIVP